MPQFLSAGELYHHHHHHHHLWPWGREPIVIDPLPPRPVIVEQTAPPVVIQAEPPVIPPGTTHKKYSSCKQHKACIKNAENEDEQKACDHDFPKCVAKLNDTTRCKKYHECQEKAKSDEEHQACTDLFPTCERKDHE